MLNSSWSFQKVPSHNHIDRFRQKNPIKMWFKKVIQKVIHNSRVYAIMDRASCLNQIFFCPVRVGYELFLFFPYDWICVERLIPFPIFFCPFSQNWENVFCWGYFTRKLGFLYSCKTLIFFSEVNLVTVQNFRKKENEVCWRLERLPFFSLYLFERFNSRRYQGDDKD